MMQLLSLTFMTYGDVVDETSGSGSHQTEFSSLKEAHSVPRKVRCWLEQAARWHNRRFCSRQQEQEGYGRRDREHCVKEFVGWAARSPQSLRPAAGGSSDCAR